MALWSLSLSTACRESRLVSLVLYPQVFDLYSCHACPGGCNKPTTMPVPCIQPSLPTDSLLLALAIFGGGSAVIAIVLLIMVMVLTHKLRKKSQYHSKLKMVASQSQWRENWLVNCSIDRNNAWHLELVIVYMMFLPPPSGPCMQVIVVWIMRLNGLWACALMLEIT